MLPSQQHTHTQTTIFSFHINCRNNKLPIFFHDFCFPFVAFVNFFSLSLSLTQLLLCFNFSLYLLCGMGDEGSRFMYSLCMVCVIARVSIAIDLIIVIHIVYVDCGCRRKLVTILISSVFLPIVFSLHEGRATNAIVPMLRTNICRFILIKRYNRLYRYDATLYIDALFRHRKEKQTNKQKVK